MLKRAKLTTYLVDEYLTSKMCSTCQQDGCRVLDKKQTPYRRVLRFNTRSKTMEESRHAKIVRCKTCERVFNRDENAAQNILSIARSHVDGTGRPRYLLRPSPSSPRGVQVVTQLTGPAAAAAVSLVPPGA